MAVHRTPPKCPKCGEHINGKYWQPETFFCGDTFQGWDWAGHVCRLGTKYFIERTDTNEWWIIGGWTKDPMKAMMWTYKNEAETYLKMSTDIPPRLDCIVTEHEFVRMKPKAGGENLIDALGEL